MKRLALISVSIVILSSLIYPQDIINETGKDGKFIVRDAEQQDALIVDDGNVEIRGGLKVETMPSGSATDDLVVWDKGDKRLKVVPQVFSKASPLSEPLEYQWHSLSSAEVDENGNYINSSVLGTNAVNWNVFNTDHGSISLGPALAGQYYGHIYTTATRFLFNKPLTFADAKFGSQNNQNFQIQTGGVARITVQGTTGNIGMGTNSPAVKLHVVGNSGQGNPAYTAGTMFAAQQNTNGNWAHIAVIAATNGAAGINFGDNNDDDAGYVRYYNLDNDLEFGTNGLERMRITSAGKVGIGTSGPQRKLHIAGATGAGNSFGLEAVEGDVLSLYYIANNGVVFDSYRSDSRRLPIFLQPYGGYIGIGTTNPTQPLQVNGDIQMGGGSSDHDGAVEAIIIGGQSDDWFVGVQNETTVGATDFYIGKSSTEDGIFHIENGGKVGINTTAPGADLDVNGYTMLGPNSPALAVRKYTGTTAASEGSAVEVNLGVSSDKVISTSLQVLYSSQWLPQPYNLDTGYEAQWLVRSDNTVDIYCKSGNSAKILSKPFVLLVWYEE